MLLIESASNGKRLRLLGAQVTVDGQIVDLTINLSACSDPVCPCKEIYITCKPSKGMDEEACFTVMLNIENQKFKNASENTNDNPQQAILRKAFIEQTNEADFTFLRHGWYATKREYTMQSDLATIKAHFDINEIENEGLTVDFFQTLPFYDDRVFEVDGQSFQIMVSFCVRSECKCRDAFIDLVAVDPVSMKATSCAEVGVNYDRHIWDGFSPKKSAPAWCASIESMREFIEKNVDIYDWLAKAHLFLRRCYQGHIQRMEKDKESIGFVPRATGRNDPCPCGSGRKYKKCCMHRQFQ